MLILDEATSALDARTERQVCLNLFEAFRGRTVFFITHRLSTVRPADMIVLMDQGAVMEVGDHKTLMGLEGWYYALYQSQSEEGLPDGCDRATTGRTPQPLCHRRQW